MLATVIKVNGRQRDQFLADPDFVYVGRKFAGFEGSIWGNPFKPGMSGQDVSGVFSRIPTWDLTDHREVDPVPISLVELFEYYVRCRKSLLAQVHELKGKKLGC